MKTIRNFAYATLLAATTLNFVPALASAQETAHGKFTLSHEVHWGGAKLPAGEYEFSFDPYTGSKMLSLSKLSGARASYMVLVPDADDAKASDSNRIVIESTPEGSYVSALSLPEFGMTLRFTVPTVAVERTIAKAGTTVVAGQ